MRETIAACCSLVLLVGIRYAGYRGLDFKRLLYLFPGGGAIDQISPKIRTEEESLVYEFYAPGTDWTRRGTIRRRLIRLEEDEPEIVEAYEQELKEVLAA